MSELPGSWARVPLDVVGSWGSGGTPTRTNDQYYAKEGIPWLVIGDLNDRVVFKSSNFITELGLANSSAKLVPAGTLLVAMYGSIGKLGITGIECATNQAIAFCKPNESIVSLRYLYYAMFNAKPDLLALGQGGAQQNISQSVLKEFDIPLAPKNEQTRISIQLDTLLTRIQSCNDRFDAIPALLKRFRQTVLDAALSGAFSESGAEEDASKVSISSIASVGTGSTPLRSNSQFFASTGTPWVTSSATSEAIIVRAHEYVTPAAISAHRLKVYPKGTLLVAMYGEGKTRGQVAELGIDATINQACAAVVVDGTKALTAFVKLALQANYLNMRELAEGGNQPNLNLSKVKDFEIPLPALAAQTQIIQRVEALFTLADRIEAYATAARAHAQRLSPLVLAKAFRGELVPQDPQDEPASALLERIAAQRAMPAEKKQTNKPRQARTPRAPKEAAAMTKSRHDDDVKDKPYLADHLRRLGVATTAEVLFNASELPVADFYKQLAWEVAQGHIADGGTTLEARHAAG